MKNIKISTILLLYYLTGSGQSNWLPPDKSGKIAFSKVVQVENASSERLFRNALNCLQTPVDGHKKLQQALWVNKDSTEITVPWAFTVYRDFPIHSPHGLIKYQLTVRVKESGYQYLIRGFTFHYLKRNRYGRLVEVKGKSKPLEEPVLKGDQKLWDKHKRSVGRKIEELVQKLQAEMTDPPEERQQKIVTEGFLDK